MSELYGPVVYTKLGSLCSKSVAGLEVIFLGSDKNKTPLEDFAVMGLRARPGSSLLYVHCTLYSYPALPQDIGNQSGLDMKTKLGWGLHYH
jgi:hypothetical protein